MHLSHTRARTHTTCARTHEHAHTLILPTAFRIYALVTETSNSSHDGISTVVLRILTAMVAESESLNWKLRQVRQSILDRGEGESTKRIIGGSRTRVTLIVGTDGPHSLRTGQQCQRVTYFASVKSWMKLGLSKTKCKFS